MYRVLIIDDEDDICNLLLYAFSRNGIEAKIATNGREGLDCFNQEHFDLVITDMLMPGVNGNNVARQIRGSSRPETPIIGISATAWLLDRNDFNAVFEKPMSIHALLDKVKDLVMASHEVPV